MVPGSKRVVSFQRLRTARRRAGPDRYQCLCRSAGLAALIGIGAAPATLATPPKMPVLMEPASQEQHPGKVVWVQLVTPDLGAAKTFYAGLFGWTFRDDPPGGPEYSEALLGGRPVAGLFQKSIKPGEHRQPAWLAYISTSDVDATTKTALQHGAKVLFGPHDVPELGRDVVLADPQGAVFAVLASSSGDPPDVLGDPGEWIWSSLITSDPDTDAAFYQTLFAYDVFDLAAEKGAQHFLLAAGGYARASVNPLPAGAVNPHPHWLNYVRVDDAVAAAAKVVALGGRVLVEPRIDRHGGKVAVVADPSGAPFGLLEWPENESKAVSP